MDKMSLIFTWIKLIALVIIEYCAVCNIFERIGRAIDKKSDLLDLKAVENNYENDKKFVSKIYVLEMIHSTFFQLNLILFINHLQIFHNVNQVQ